jgi:uncharacterized membrane protein
MDQQRRWEMPIDRSTLGPVEMLAVAFPGSELKGAIVPALRELVESGVIRILDLAFVKKELDGTVTALEVNELDDDGKRPYGALGAPEQQYVKHDDLVEVAQDLDPGDSAALLVWEDRWAMKLAAAIRDVNGKVLALEHVPHETVDDVLDELAGD